MDLTPKGLLKRVFDFALSEIDRRSRPPERLASEPGPVVAAVDAGQAPRSDGQTPREGTHRPRETNASHIHAVDADVPLEVTRAASGAVMVRWSVSELEISSARPLAPTDANLTVRLVSFMPDAQVHVRRNVLDLPAETLTGYFTLQRPGNERLVVSVGLLAGEQFVSIVHAQLG